MDEINNQKTNEKNKIKIQIVSEYYMNTQGFWNFAYAFFVTFMVIMAIVVVIKITINSQASRLTVDPAAKMQYMMAKSITMTMEIFSTIFFWFTFAMCAWWFVFYKLQSRVYCFMPGLDTYIENYKYYDDMLISLTVLKLISLLYNIVFEQSALDIFMIDWEAPKMYRTNRGKRGQNMKQAVSPWRRLFLCNEYKELMIYK